MRIILSNEEFYVLSLIARKTKMDCWFNLCETDRGDYVQDLEECKILTLRQGVLMLNEGIVPELLDLTDREIEIYSNLLKELDINENPFKEAQL